MTNSGIFESHSSTSFQLSGNEDFRRKKLPDFLQPQSYYKTNCCRGFVDRSQVATSLHTSGHTEIQRTFSTPLATGVKSTKAQRSADEYKAPPSTNDRRKWYSSGNRTKSIPEVLYLKMTQVPTSQITSYNHLSKMRLQRSEINSNNLQLLNRPAKRYIEGPGRVDHIKDIISPTKEVEFKFLRQNQPQDRDKLKSELQDCFTKCPVPIISSYSHQRLKKNGSKVAPKWLGLKRMFFTFFLSSFGFF
ncbi:uncharacterized protein LOC136041052 isoform X2 [Artemia franciscana]|uniref:uncharacterized protein LOC136041052 isoform X2 n=1 Tax=Artemia franciscana TaxID=6661 RepID=UPI0032DBA4E0